MKKVYAGVAALMIGASSAFGGNATMEAPMEPMIEEPDAMGGSAMWIIPLLAIGLIALAMSGDDTPS